MQPTILVVDDESAIVSTLATILQHAGYAAVTAPNASEALVRFAQCEPALVISDVVMPGMNGIEMALTIHALRPQCPVMLISGNATTEDLLASVRECGHVFEVLAKPLPPRELLARVASVVRPGPLTA